MRQYLTAAVLIVAAVHLEASPPRPGPLRVVPDVDYQRYAGTWYEIARLPNRFQREDAQKSCLTGFNVNFVCIPRRCPIRDVRRLATAPSTSSGVRAQPL
jgi:hypothetical protein